MGSFNYGGSDNPFDSLSSAVNDAQSIILIAIVTLIIAAIGGIILYFTFLAKRNEDRKSVV